ncbi:MAG: glycosyltransferase family 4 protein [Isosphaeraceae bacterium]
MHLALNYQRVDPSRGGAETYVADLCRLLIAGGHRVDLYVESCARDCLPAEVNVVVVPATGRTKLDRIWSFAQNSESAMGHGAHECSVGFINTWAHDVIIPQGGVQEGSLRANARRFPTGLQRGLYRLSKSANPKYWLYRAIEHKQYDPGRSSRFVAVSEMVRRHLEEYQHVPRQEIHVVPNAIDLERIEVSQPGAIRCAFRNRMGLEPNDLAGLFVGHNFALKGLEPLIESLGARNQRGQGRTIHLLVSGGGNAAPYRRLARSLGIEDSIHFLGFHPDVRECYWSSDFFVQPTYYDPCSLVVLEALACGLPVITTEQNGASELMTDGREGYVLTSPGAQAELIAALDRMTNDATRQSMSGEALRLGRRQTFDDHVSRLLTIFHDVSRSRAGRGPHSRLRGQGGPRNQAERSGRSRRGTMGSA